MWILTQSLLALPLVGAMHCTSCSSENLYTIKAKSAFHFSGHGNLGIATGGSP